MLVALTAEVSVLAVDQDDIVLMTPGLSQRIVQGIYTLRLRVLPCGQPAPSICTVSCLTCATFTVALPGGLNTVLWEMFNILGDLKGYIRIMSGFCGSSERLHIGKFDLAKHARDSSLKFPQGTSLGHHRGRTGKACTQCQGPTKEEGCPSA